MLKDSTTTIFFTINHPLPLELKLLHLQSELFEAIVQNCPELLVHRERLAILEEVFIKNCNLQIIANMDAQQLHDYAYDLLNKYKSEMRRREIIGALSLLLLAIGLGMLF